MISFADRMLRIKENEYTDLRDEIDFDRNELLGGTKA